MFSLSFYFSLLLSILYLSPPRHITGGDSIGVSTTSGNGEIARRAGRVRQRGAGLGRRWWRFGCQLVLSRRDIKATRRSRHGVKGHLARRRRHRLYLCGEWRPANLTCSDWTKSHTVHTGTDVFFHNNSWFCLERFRPVSFVAYFSGLLTVAAPPFCEWRSQSITKIQRYCQVKPPLN